MNTNVLNTIVLLPRYTLLLCANVVLLACGATPVQQLLPISHELVSGKAATITLNNTDNVILMPGGPYVSKQVNTGQTVRHIAASERFVYAITDSAKYSGDSELVIVDFQRRPATAASRHNLTDTINNILLVDNTLFLGTQNNGVTIIDNSEPGTLSAITRHENQYTIVDLHYADHRVYALTDQQQILVFEQTQSTVNPHWRVIDTFTIPVYANSMAVKKNRLFLTGPNIGIRMYNLQQPNKLIDRYPLQGQGKQLRLIDQYAYVADGTGGLAIFDISTTNKLRWVGSHNKLESIQKTVSLDDRLLVMDGRKRVATLNMSRPSLPITGSFYKPRHPVQDIAGHQGQLYIATGSTIEQLVFPANPQRQISNEGINQGGTRRAFISNDIAYVADWFSGLHLYDISIPHFPRHLGNYHTPGSSKGVIVKGQYAYVGDDDHGLQIIDISNPRRPKKVSEVLSTGLAYTMKMVNELIYLADHSGGLHIIDVSNVKQPAIIGSFDTPGKSWAVDVVDNVAYIADDNSGLLIFDVSDPRQPRQIAQFNPQGYAEDVLLKDDIAYVSFFDKGLFLVDVSNPQQPRQISQLDIPGNARSITLSNGYAYVAGWESGLQIIDINDPQAPRIVASYDTKGSAWGVDVYKQHAYVWDWWGGVKVINVQDPQRPRLAGKYHTRGDIQQLRMKDSYIYTANGAGGVQVFDIKNVLNPIWVTGYDSPGDVRDIWPTPQYAYTANGGHGISIFDISDPFYIAQLSQLQTPGNAYIIREHQHTLYVADSKAGLLSIDVSDPTNPVPLEQYPLDINDLWVNEGIVYAATAHQGLRRFKPQPNGKLLALNPSNLPHNVQWVRGNGKYIFAAVDSEGVYLLQPTATMPTENKTSQSSQTLSVVALYEVDEKIIGIQASAHSLYIATALKGLLDIDITNPSSPLATVRYPATDHLGPFAVNAQAAFFGGSHTIASVEFLPPRGKQQQENDGVTLTLPANFPLGNYHLISATKNAPAYFWPNAIKVTRSHTNKPKLSQEDFEKLLKKHRAQQKSTTPVP